MFRSGSFVADHLGDVDPVQVQPNGVDLRLDGIFLQRTPGSITTEGSDVGDRESLSPEERPDRNATASQDTDSFPGRDIYQLAPGGYIAQYAETVSIPEGHVGFVLPRSSLMRNSCMLNTAVWDAGYTGRGEGLLQVYHDVSLERGARIAQLVLAEADHEGLYDGRYQRERLD